jgi:hypothetical protein
MPPACWCIHTCFGAHQTFNVNGQQFELRSRQRESGCIADRSLPVEKDDDAVFTVEQLIDLLVNTLRISPGCFPQSHRSDLRCPCERRKVNSSAPGPKVATASAHKTSAST